MRLFLFLFILPSAHASEPFTWEHSHTWEDKGVSLSRDDTNPSEPISLHALLNMQFNAELGAMSYSGTDHIKLKLHRSYLDVDLRGNEGAYIGKQSWKTETYEAPEGNGLMVRIESLEHHDDSVVLMLETTSEGRVLQAKVVHMKATTFGPKLTEIGTYFFTRV